MGGGSSNNTTSAPSVSGLRVQTTVLGRCVPWMFGTSRVAPNLIAQEDFTPIPHTEQQSGGKGGGGNSSSTSYTYSAAIIMALCRGAIDSVGRIWIAKDQKTAQQLNIDIYNGNATQTPHPYWTTKHPDNALAYRGLSYAASGKYDLGDNGEVPSHNFEIFTPTRISSTIPDANPAVILREILTNKVDGLGFDPAKIDLTAFSNFCLANSIWISPCYSEQIAAHEAVERIAEMGHSAVVISEGKFKLLPYADTATVGNGATFTPNTAPVYDLNEDDFLNDAQPIKITRTSLADAENHYQVTFYDRGNDYNESTAEAQDQSHIEQFGLRTKDPDDYKEICDAQVAQKLVSFKIARSLGIRCKYEFKLSLRYALLEPMDIVTLTYANDGLYNVPVRITEVEEDENGNLSVKCEDCPLGSQSPTLQPAQTTLAATVNYNAVAGNVNVPVIFEPSLQLTRGATEVWAAVSGGQNWGGCEVWASLDNATYDKVGHIDAPARQGVLSVGLASGALIDSTSTLSVDTNQSRGALFGGTQADADAGVTLCYVDGELLAYKNAQLTGVNTYDLSYLVRGLYGTTIAAHAAGTKFARLDDSIFKMAYKPEWVGKMIYLKFVSHNSFGTGEQSIADATAYPYTIAGAPLKPVTTLAFEKPWIGKEAKIRWDLVDGACRYEVQVYTGSPSTLARTVTTVTEGQFTYTLDMAKQDGGLSRNIIFKVRPASITNNYGAYAQLMASNPQIAGLTGLLFNPGILQSFMSYDKPADADWAGVRVWLGTDPNLATTDANCVYDGTANPVLLNKLPSGATLDGGVTYYVKIAGYDDFGKDNLTIAAALSFTVNSVAAMAKDLSESNLATTLKSRIDLVDGSGAGSVTARIATESNNRTVAIGTETTNRLAQIAAESSNRAAAIAAESNSRTVAISAETTNRLNQIATESSNRTAAIAVEAAARGTADAQLSTSISTITASTNTGLASNTAAISTEQTARSNADSALGSRIDVVIAQSTTDRSAAAAAVSGEATARTNADSALSSQITTLTATVNSNNSTQTAAITTEQTARANADGTLSGRIDSLTATQTSDKATLNASIQSEASARTTADNALTSRVDAVVATANTDRNSLTASVNSEATARANADSAQATQINTIVAKGVPAGNMLFNPEFAVNLDGWNVASSTSSTVSFGRNLSSDWTVGAGTAYLTNTDATNPTGFNDVRSTPVDVLAGKVYQASVCVAAHRCNVSTYIMFLDSSSTEVGSSAQSEIVLKDVFGGGKTLAGYKNLTLFTQVPANAVKARLLIRKTNTLAGSDSFAFFTRAIFCEAAIGQTVPTAYSPAGYTGDTRIEANAAAITTEAAARTNADSALSSQITTLTATVNSNNSAQTAAITTEQTARANADSALGSRIDVVIAQSTTDRSTAAAAVSGEATARTNADSALSSQITTLTATINSNKSSQTAAITAEQTARANADGALSGRVDAVIATINSDRGNAAAAVSSEAAARASADSALSQQISTVQTSVNGNTASIQTQTTSINGLQAQYTVKTDVNGYVSGFGLATTPNNGAPQSSFIINADKFGVGAAGKGTSYPFIVDTAKNIIGVNGTLLVDGTVNATAIIASSITGDKIAANTINANHLQAGSISADKLMVGASSNMLVNAGFESDFYGWNQYAPTAAGYRGFNMSTDWMLAGVTNKTLAIQHLTVGNEVFVLFQDVLAEVGKTYVSSVYVGSHRCTCRLFVTFRDASDNIINSGNNWTDFNGGSTANSTTGSGGKYIGGYKRLAIRSTAPVGAVKMRFEIQKLSNDTGSSDGWIFAVRPYAGECLPNQTELPPWDAAGATTIGAGSVKTDTLSAITSNLGNITGGSLNINNRFIVAADGTTTIRSGTTGQRTEMDNQQFRVYDANGVLRVRLGIW